MSNHNDSGPGILCPSCGNPHTSTVESRKGRSGKLRRRRCDNCSKRFRTIELHITSLSAKQREQYGISIMAKAPL